MRNAAWPAHFVLTADDIQRQIETDLGAALELFKGLEVRRPEVALMPTSERLQLTWTLRVPDGPNNLGLGVAVAVAGQADTEHGAQRHQPDRGHARGCSRHGRAAAVQFRPGATRRTQGHDAAEFAADHAAGAADWCRDQVAYGATGRGRDFRRTARRHRAQVILLRLASCRCAAGLRPG